MAEHNSAWTAPYCRVQHLLKQPASKGRWATVTDWNSFAELAGWYPGCAFSPYEATFDTIQEARAAGERWVSEGVFPHGDQRTYPHDSS